MGVFLTLGGQIMQIYTRTGDHGTTRLIGGKSVHKDDARIHAYGSIDELNSMVGLYAGQFQLWPNLQSELQEIQQLLFDCGNDFATPDEIYPYRMQQESIDWLEDRIDYYSQQTPNIESFILPGGDPLAGAMHVLRSVARRCERECVTFSRQAPFNPLALKFLNRVSDYFFAAARYANVQAGVADIAYVRSGKVFHNDVSKDKLPK